MYFDTWYWVGLGIIIFFSIFAPLFLITDEEKYIKKYITTIFILILIFGGLFTFSYYEPNYKSERVDIISLHENIGAQGSFFLGTGAVKGEPVYCFYVEVSDNTFKEDWIEADATYIHYDDSDTPHLIIQKRNYWPTCEFLTYQYDLYVPSGTIKEVYHLGGN